MRSHETLYERSCVHMTEHNVCDTIRESDCLEWCIVQWPQLAYLHHHASTPSAADASLGNLFLVYVRWRSSRANSVLARPQVSWRSSPPSPTSWIDTRGSGAKQIGTHPMLPGWSSLSCSGSNIHDRRLRAHPTFPGPQLLWRSSSSCSGSNTHDRGRGASNRVVAHPALPGPQLPWRSSSTWSDEGSSSVWAQQISAHPLLARPELPWRSSSPRPPGIRCWEGGCLKSKERHGYRCTVFV